MSDHAGFKYVDCFGRCLFKRWFFFNEMTIGPMWAVPMDIAPKHAGTASGIMNTGSALAAIISPFDK
jgi:hypothetical protein